MQSEGPAMWEWSVVRVRVQVQFQTENLSFAHIARCIGPGSPGVYQPRIFYIKGGGLTRGICIL
jgi:hypothetical protein